MKLYSYFRSSASYRARIALNLKQLDYEIIPINLVKGEQKQAEYLKINPQGLVPSLVTEEGVLSQSVALMEWLEEKYPQPSIISGNAWQKTQIRRATYAITSEVQPLQNLRVLQYLQKELSASDEQKNNWVRYWIMHTLTALEEMIEGQEFCFGCQPSMADIVLIPQLYNADRFACDFSALDKINRVRQNCLKHPAFIKAAPENQMDAI